MPSTERILQLVQQTLDEIDDRPVDVSVRRAIRIASLLGESEVAVRLGYEVKPSGGHPPSNAADTRRLMAEPELWGDREGPAENAITEYVAERALPDGMVDGHSLSELSFWEAIAETTNSNELNGDDYRQYLEVSERRVRIIERARHRVFTLLCAWERQLTYSNTNERIFGRFQRTVDAVLARGAPEVLERFNAVYRRLADAARDNANEVSEELAQALTSCRRILKAVADQVQPPVHGAETPEGHSLDNQHYRNRLYEFTKKVGEGDSADAALAALIGGVYDRFEALDKLTSKGVHADVAQREAELCAISTYIVAGELLERYAAHAGGGNADDGR